MRTLLRLLPLLPLLLPAPLAAQTDPPPFAERVRMAEVEGADIETLVTGANAARTLRDMETADALLQRALQRFNAVRNAVIAAAINNELAAGRGVNGAQRVFRSARGAVTIEPLALAAWVNSYPELLVGGEFDETIERMSADAADPRYRCACLAQKAWMYRVAGDIDRSRAYWDSAAASVDLASEATPAVRAQRVRNLARAGRTAEARRLMSQTLPAEGLESVPPAARRYWAQAYAELGGVERAVEILEGLLGDRTLVTPESIRARVSWDGVRDHPAFEALLARHPVTRRAAER
ncbi:MAG: hypothetical protein KY453_09625 [Gemmatimonadetes bacterium]|nr:hypothetical protein [Gemmatimonadota bacterium]